MFAAIALLVCIGSFPTIHIDRNSVLRRFDPAFAFGAAVDGHFRGEVETMLSPTNTNLMKSMGLRSLTYRLRTELGNEIWHWNPEGAWSDSEHDQGYWASSVTNSKPILVTNGYRLPRRGDSVDQANRDDYSRLDDGDPKTFWKSNPYLDPAYTGVSYEKSPQWIMLDFRHDFDINEMRFLWATPFPARYRIEYIENPHDDRPWRTAKPISPVSQHVGVNRARFGKFRARFIKIVLLESSENAPPGSKDRRDGLGFAVGEVSAGLTGPNGVFHDVVHHAKSNSFQTIVYVSSTDPWHRNVDIDRRTEQPGFDLVLERALGQGQSMLVPTGCLYDTPENVANEIRWLKKRGVKLRGVELGEEPDGNWVDADQYGQLYMQMAHAIHAVAPDTRLGGPSLQSVYEDYAEWPKDGEHWLPRFKRTLRDRGRLADFSFCSFEWYPFDDVKGDVAAQLKKAPSALDRSIRRLNRLGMNGMPWFLTEFGWSSYAAPVEVNAPAAVFDLEVALSCLSKGCETSYQYGYEPTGVVQEIPGAWGNLTALLKTKNGPEKLPTYWSAWLLTHRLCAEAGTHKLLETTGGDSHVGAYAVQRPDGSVVLALLNRTPAAQRVAIDSGQATLKGWTYGQQQFLWLNVGGDSRPHISKSPEAVMVKPSGFSLGPYSITVLTAG